MEQRMCELMGMSANVPTDICFSFSGLMQRGGHGRVMWGVDGCDGEVLGTARFTTPIAVPAIRL
jgi:glutamine amidotransferase